MLGSRTILYGLLFFACLSACVFAVTLSPSYHSCVSDAHASEPNDQQYSFRGNIGILIVCETTTLNTNNGALTALGTLAVALFTLTLWVVTGTAVSLAREEFLSTKRAFVSLQDFEVDARKAGKLQYSRFDIIPRWRNSGTTPTQNLTVQIWWKRHTGNLPENFEYPFREGEMPAPLFIGPQSTERSAKEELSPANINDVVYDAGYTTLGQAGRQYFIWGRARYQTTLGDGATHVCEWCYRLEFISLDADNLSHSFVQWGRYNRTYEEKNA
jgi:hypothetical protein